MQLIIEALMTNTETRGIHWFRHDLRTTDNQALAKLMQETKRCVGVYVFDPSWHIPNQWACSHLGHYRQAFIESAVLDLQQRMRALGSDLLVLEGDPVAVITKLAKANHVSHISYEFHSGWNERQAILQLSDSLPDVNLLEGHSNYLYEHDSLPFALENMPDTFSPTRRKLEKYAEPRLAVSKTQSSPAFDLNVQDLPSYTFASNEPLGDYSGGESAALSRINTYFFVTDGIASYKETRNGLDGWDFSSRLSAFLAHGCVSPATVVAKLKQYEGERVANDSTYWLFFELLWREFFHLQHIKHGKAFFDFDGIQNKKPTTHFDQNLFNKWCSGETGYAIVDASMRQLNQTGFMSNRGRQLVASCFVHELGLDWRYGAAYFEQQLIDFDVASNWGNWQYLAGVGSDPRGHRQFNLAKQTEIYDPKGEFVKRWLS
jgi:deoxyribodipyrimidine photo-lyase